MNYSKYRRKYNDIADTLKFLYSSGIFNEVYDYTVERARDILEDAFLEMEIDFDKAHEFIYFYIDNNDLCNYFDYMIDYYKEIYEQ